MIFAGMIEMLEFDKFARFLKNLIQTFHYYFLNSNFSHLKHLNFKSTSNLTTKSNLFGRNNLI